ncbi:DUF3796 domain-containing protein [Oceanobacillus halophilus]|uniref:DUF3796 domain-containing protein n=1 Tax=Oceanobacillus halophilus TaxID=930130 RepID=UPI001314DC69|nr:DUF3796 domain-containing protein [Oceanobacillus halophilus]
MSESLLNTLYGLSGVIGAGIVLLIVFFINWRIGKKKHLFDERYQQQTNRAKARSWDAMIVIYMIAWVIVIIFDGISFSFFLLTALLVLHNMTAAITNMYFLNKE